MLEKERLAVVDEKGDMLAADGGQSFQPRCLLVSSLLRANTTHLNFTKVMPCFFGQIASRRTLSFSAREGYCSSNLVRMPRCTDDLTAVDEAISPLVGWNDLKSDIAGF